MSEQDNQDIVETTVTVEQPEAEANNDEEETEMASASVRMTGDLLNRFKICKQDLWLRTKYRKPSNKDVLVDLIQMRSEELTEKES